MCIRDRGDKGVRVIRRDLCHRRDELGGVAAVLDKIPEVARQSQLRADELGVLGALALVEVAERAVDGSHHHIKVLRRELFYPVSYTHLSLPPSRISS